MLRCGKKRAAVGVDRLNACRDSRGCIGSATVMIIACPACATRYVVPDSAIGLEGRTVRCAKCKHSWFQDGPELAAEPIAVAYAEPGGQAAPAPPQPRPRPAAVPPEPVARANAAPPPRPAEPVSRGPAPDELPTPPRPAAGIDWDEPRPQAPLTSAAPTPAFDAPPIAGDWAPAEPELHEVSQFEHEPPFRPRRNWLRWLTWGAGAFAAISLAVIVAMSTLGTPSWLPVDRPLFGADPGLKVEFPASEQERRTLPNGAEFFGARVVVTNEARETRRVPPLLIVLRDGRERVVYSWELIPPQRSLAPGEAMTINEAMTDVPKSAVYADIGWAPR